MSTYPHMRRAWSAVGCCLIFGVVLAGCTSGKNTAPAQQAAPNTGKITLYYLQKQGDQQYFVEQAQGAQQADRPSLLARCEPRDGVADRVGVRREYPMDHSSAGRSEREQDDAAVGGAATSPHQPAFHELVHDVGGTRRLDQDAPLHVAHGQLPPVVQHFQDAELRGTQPEAGDAHPRVAFHGIERPGEHDEQP